MLLILDLDGTLIDTTLITNGKTPDMIWSDNFDTYYIYKRPGLDDFLKWSFAHWFLADSARTPRF